jgi:hypothetical protein
MKTDQLVTMLATQVAPVPRHAAFRRFAGAGLVGVALGAVWMVLAFGLRGDLARVVLAAGFWAKLLLPACIVGAGLVLAQRLGRPGVAGGRAWWAVWLPLLAIWGVALTVLAQAPPEDRLPLVMGQTWRSCALSIGMLSIPAFVSALLALRSLAPTRPALAGAAAGLMAGGVGAFVYAFHCPEADAPFLAVWYVAGMALPVLAGAVLGPRVARW